VSVYGLQVEWAVGSDTGPDSLQRLSVAFERAGEVVGDFGANVFPLLVPVFEDELGRQFAAEGGGPSGPWAPLSEAYEAWKTDRFPGQPILVATGALREALTDSVSQQAWREWSASAFSFGTAGVEYASFHQTGTGRMPARPPFDFGEAFEADLASAAMAGLRDAIRGVREDLTPEGGP